MRKDRDFIVEANRNRLVRCWAMAIITMLPLGLWASSGAAGDHASGPSTPGWAQDLIIYEVAPKAFTSPSGPESGTFTGLRDRLPYLQDLGITGIWLSGHSLADPHHFYNIWTQYAVIEPDRLDPSLGTPEQFQSLIDEAHRRGIKIFLDVIDHGVMASSSLVKEHPQWFRGGSWGMVDFDYFGGHTDFDRWWIETWTDYVTRFGVDGFRLDTNTPRPDLWAQVRQNAFDSGHPIVIWEEGNGAIPGVTDFSQHDNRLAYSAVTGVGLGDARPRVGSPVLNRELVDDVAGYFDRLFGKVGHYTVEIQYTDSSKAQGTTEHTGGLTVHLDGLTADKASLRSSDRRALPDGAADVQLTVDNVASQSIQSISISDDNGGHWVAIDGGDGTVAVEGQAPHLRLYLATHSQGFALQMSCHDNGWEGFPEDQNPYIAQGSRALFGYSFLFTPTLPIFMSGEEFDAQFHPLPDLSPDLFGGDNPGRGRWLYGSMLDWNEFRQPQHRAMYDDVKKMLEIRKRYGPILRPVRGDVEPALLSVPYVSDIYVPKPYIRWQASRAILIAANRNTQRSAHLTFHMPIEKLNWPPEGRYQVTDLWNGGKPKVYSAAQLILLSTRITPDKTPRGGLSVLEIEVLP